MHITVYDHSDTPYVLEHVTRIQKELEGDTIIMHDAMDGWSR
jgi:hypothetical protein